MNVLAKLQSATSRYRTREQILEIIDEAAETLMPIAGRADQHNTSAKKGTSAKRNSI